jgi:hypothetical protein
LSQEVGFSIKDNPSGPISISFSISNMLPIPFGFPDRFPLVTGFLSIRVSTDSSSSSVTGSSTCLSPFKTSRGYNPYMWIGSSSTKVPDEKPIYIMQIKMPLFSFQRIFISRVATMFRWLGCRRIVVFAFHPADVSLHSFVVHLHWFVMFHHSGLARSIGPEWRRHPIHLEHEYSCCNFMTEYFDSTRGICDSVDHCKGY